MLPPSRAFRVTVFTLALVLLAARPGGSAPSPTEPLSPMAAGNLEAERRAGEKIAPTVAQALGPLAPVALSPFFALTCLSGASLLADSGLPFTDGIKRNPILGKGSPLHNGVVFAGLLGLTLLTAAPKLTKVTKPLGQAIDQIEAHAGIIAVVVVQLLSSVDFGSEPAPAGAMMFQAGIFSFSFGVILAAFSAINIFVVNTVKFFFEVLTWLSPFPLVDAVFEAANKACATALLGIYLWSPTIATVVNLIIFAVCLVVFGWVYRRVVYMRSVLGDPILGWLAEKVFRRPAATLTSTRLPSSIAAQVPPCSLVLKAFAGQAMPGVKRKMRGFLVQAEGRVLFARTKLFRPPVIVPLGGADAVVALETGLLSNTVVLTSQSGATATRLIFSRRYNRLLDGIRTQLAAAAEARPAEHSSPSERALAASRAVGAAAKVATGRDELRAELA